MRGFATFAAAAALLAGCGREDPDVNAAEPAQPPRAPEAEPAAPALPPPVAASRWTLQSGGEGTALVLPAAGGGVTIRLFCPAGGRTLLVNVPAFRPIGSEERLSFGGAGDAVTLVADSGGDRLRGGVSGSGPVPSELDRFLSGPLSASYGAQTSGPHPVPPPAAAATFAAACRGKAAPAAPAAPPAATVKPAGDHPCRTQDGQRLSHPPLRALGTEPFWAARIDGRCVTYSHPEDQKGTRIWTRHSPAPGGGGTWSGSLAGRPFELRVRPAAGCSDGMSDRRYPMAADLLVSGERRTGCAEPQG
jgi:uncharacterized membrane protein